MTKKDDIVPKNNESREAELCSGSCRQFRRMFSIIVFSYLHFLRIMQHLITSRTSGITLMIGVEDPLKRNFALMTKI